MNQNDQPTGSSDLIRILVADDHEVVRDGVISMIASQPDMKVVAEARNGREAVDMFRAYQPDVSLIDLQMPELSGHDTVVEIRALSPAARIIVLTTFDTEDDIQRVLEAGALAYLLKDVTKAGLLGSIRRVHAGQRCIAPTVAAKLADRFTRVQLTARELEVLRLVCDGLLNKEIAARLSISESTVKLHTNNLYSKLGVSNRTEAMRAAIQRGLLRI